jgi:hypothetical protein
MDAPIPQNGFYYHYKHDPDGPFNNYAYEVTGLARHSEDKTNYVMYRPLYENTYLSPAHNSIRPLELFSGDVVRGGEIVRRFIEIRDPDLIARLKEVRNQMYG